MYLEYGTIYKWFGLTLFIQMYYVFMEVDSIMYCKMYIFEYHNVFRNKCQYHTQLMQLFLHTRSNCKYLESDLMKVKCLLK